MRTYYQLPDIPDAGLLLRYLDTLGVVVPLARTNLVINPSGETGTTGYTAVGGGASIFQTYGTNIWGGSASFHGAYSIATYTNAANEGLYYGPIALTSGITYAYSCKLIGTPGETFKISIATTGGVDLVVTRVTGTGLWQWVWGFWKETSTTNRRFYVVHEAAAPTLLMVDGLQIESCADGFLVPTTYIDGDQAGLVPNQYPPAYGWNGTPHASTSYRTGQTRAGGRVMKFKSFGFLLTAIIGLGLAAPDHQALTFAQLDGGQYENTLKPPRQFSLAGRWGGYTPNELDAGMAQLGRLLDRDRIAQRQPLVLTMQAQNCDVPCGEPVQIQALYSGGMEGNVQELPSAAQGISFTQYLPVVLSAGQGVPLTVQTSVASVNSVMRRAPDGTWGKLGTGAAGGNVYAVAQGLDGLLYLAGDFTSFNGVANTARICSYDPVTGTVAALGTGTASGLVIDLSVAPDGKIYAVGTFANMGGVAAADFVAIWNPVTLAWSAPGTPPTVSATGPSAPAGGAFDLQGRFYLAATTTAVSRWNGSAWSTLATGTVEAYSVIRAPDGNMVFGFNGAGTIGGAVSSVVKYNVAAATWAAYGNALGIQSVSLAFDSAGQLYVAGASNLDRSNGVTWTALTTTSGGGGLSHYEVTYNPLSALIYTCGDFTAVNGVTVADSLYAWNGAAAIPPDVDLPGTAGTTIVGTVASFSDGSVVVAFNATGAATAAGITTASNASTAGVYPRLTIRGPSSGTSRIYSLINTITGAAIYLNYTISAGEKAVLTLDPKNVTFISTFQGNILNTILPGSQTTSFILQPGDNAISFFAASSSVTAVLDWQIGYVNLNDALQMTVP